MEITQVGTGYQAKSSEAIPSEAVREQRAGGKAAGEALVSGEALQVGVKLKLVLGSDKHIVAVSGIQEEDGSSLLTASLGAALASIDQNPVLVIDANTRNSRLNAIFHAPERKGLLNALDGNAELNEVSHPVSPGNLFYLPLGQSTRSLAFLISQPRCARLMAEIRLEYRYVLVDCGAICDSPDNILLASLADGIVGAAATGARRRDEILSFQQTLQPLKIPLLGIVLTKGYAAK